MERWLLAHVQGGGRVLDLACGTGRLTERIVAAYVVGLDISRGMLVEAQRRRLRVVLGDGNALPFVSSAFDAVVCTDSAFALLDPLCAVSECARVLRAGGTLAVHYPTDAIWSPRRPFALTPNRGAPLLSGEQLVACAAEHGLQLKATALYRWLRVPPYLVRVRTPIRVRVWNHALLVWTKRAGYGLRT
jgi:SAM-dependent methyltransferase